MQMNMRPASRKLNSVHPFPARMAPSIVRRELASSGRSLRVLDPMAGSGTTLVTARAQGHKAVGFDTDPLAVLITRAWCSNIDKVKLRKKATEVVVRARSHSNYISFGEAYPRNADSETRKFTRFWFDSTNRRQLKALADAIFGVRDEQLRVLLWCAFSKLIITKEIGASLAMDVSHSRPHLVYKKAPIKPFDRFASAIEAILRNLPFDGKQKLKQIEIKHGDARCLPVRGESIDMVVTSPPYLNAIDYLRGHKFSLIWMGHKIKSLRKIRSSNVGSESPPEATPSDQFVRNILEDMGAVGDLPKRFQKMLAQYVADMDRVLSEISRVLKTRGRAVLVVGDSTLHGVFVRNSRAIVSLARRNHLHLQSTRRRRLPANRRYLPPPTSTRSGAQLQTRMREEIIINLVKR